MLQQYITEVLFKQQACSIPQVGTFSIQHIPAHFSVVDQLLTPPRQQVTFESRWEDDGSCLHWISQRENLVESVAAFKMDKYLHDFRESLQTGQPMDLPGIGSLRLDPVGQIRFTPQELPDLWQPISLQPVLRPDAAPKVLQGNTEVVNHEVVEHTTVVPEEFESRGRFRWWWVAVPAVVLAAGISFWLLKDQLSGYSTTTADNQLADTPIVAPAAVKAAPDTVQTVTPPVSDSIDYLVVFQTFRQRGTAEKSLQKRIAWGYPEVVLFASSDSSRYSLAVPFRTLPADTTMAMDSIRSRFKMNVYIERN